jgi:hypothetical protein
MRVSAPADPHAWLREQLRKQPRLESRLLQRARRHGISVEELRRAAENLNVDRGGEPLRFWTLPLKR